jgi:phytoene desaturase
MHRIVEVLLDAALQAGAHLRVSAPVQRIDVDGVRAQGVTLADGEHLPADVVVANADLPYVYQELLPPNAAADKLARKRYSCSTISFFWGLKRTFPELHAHMLFLSRDYLGGFESLREPGLPQKPSLYVHVPGRLDPSMSVPGRETLIGVVPIGHLQSNPHADWSAMTDRARVAVFDWLSDVGHSGLHDNIDFEVAYTPASWRERYNLYKGATHGLSHTLTQMAYLRPRNRHAQYSNLYFAGASTHPGTGVPTVLISGRLAAERIVDDLM